MRVLAVSGSLRKGSFNTAALRALKSLAPADVEFVIFQDLGAIPRFNPDLGDGTEIPALRELREQIRSADRVIFASPEYIHAIPGVLKNAFDWIVGTGELDQNPVGIINVTTSSMNANYAQDSLREILNVMSGGNVIPDALLAIGQAKLKFAEDGTVTDPATTQALSKFLEALIRGAKKDRNSLI